MQPRQFLRRKFLICRCGCEKTLPIPHHPKIICLTQQQKLSKTLRQGNGQNCRCCLSISHLVDVLCMISHGSQLNIRNGKEKTTRSVGWSSVVCKGAFEYFLQTFSRLSPRPLTGMTKSAASNLSFVQLSFEIIKILFIH